MNIGFINWAAGLGVSFESVVLLIAVTGSIIFFAKDFKLGITIMFITMGGLFMWFYSAGLNYVPALMVMFMALIIMAFTFYAVSKTAGAPGGGVI